MSGRRTGLLLAATILFLAAAAALSFAAPPEAVTIQRDAWGVPHIFTHGRHALERGSYGNGYAQTQPFTESELEPPLTVDTIPVMR